MASHVFEDLASRATVRARVAMVLTVGEHVVRRGLHDHDNVGITNEAIGMAWAWNSGDHISADKLYEELVLVESAVGRRNNADQKNAWLCLISALYFVTYCAYCAEGINSFPNPFDELNGDEAYREVFAYAARTAHFDCRSFLPLKDQLIQHCAASDPLEFGPPLGAGTRDLCRSVASMNSHGDA